MAGRGRIMFLSNAALHRWSITNLQTPSQQTLGGWSGRIFSLSSVFAETAAHSRTQIWTKNLRHSCEFNTWTKLHTDMDEQHAGILVNAVVHGQKTSDILVKVVHGQSCTQTWEKRRHSCECNGTWTNLHTDMDKKPQTLL